MSKIVTIMAKEYKNFFTSATAYVAGGLFILITGFMYTEILFAYASRSLMMMYQGGKSEMSLTEFVFPPHFGNINVLMLFFIPPITMKLMSDEYRNRTMDLLMTSPITATHIVLGKFFAGVLFVWSILAVLALHPIAAYFFAPYDRGPVITGYLGLMLSSGVYVAVCLFASSLTENPIISAVLGFIMCLFLWVIGWASQGVDSPALQSFFSNLSIVTHFADFTKGVLNSQGVIYYFSLIFFFCFLSQRVVESARWR